MKIAYFDCFSGASGDMILGAMIDAGLPADCFHRTVQQLRLPGCAVQVRRVRRGGLPATAVTVVEGRTAPFVTLARIKRHIEKSALPTDIQTHALSIFARLADAEAEAHGVKTAHFHEIGAVDTLVDVVCAVAGLAALEIDRVIVSPIHVGCGTVQTAHGQLPIPPPATALLLRGCPVYSTGAPGELTTPTGAAILTTLAADFSPLPMMTVAAIGAGAGVTERGAPNLLRLWIGTTPEVAADDEVAQIETNIDDMNPQIYEHVIERLFSEGALDVFLTPVIMKRGRPGILLTALAQPARTDALVRLLFLETTTLGVRIRKVARRTLQRTIEKVATPRGIVRMKAALQDGKTLRRRPEFRDVKAISKRAALPLAPLLSDVTRIET